MRDRWNAAESAAAGDDLGQLVYQSRLLGAETQLVVWGGGNTSVKLTEPDFRGRPTRAMRIKGSGSDLRTIERRHFPAVRLDDLEPLIERQAMTDEEMVAYLAHTMLEPGGARPSIETLLHAFLPFRSVVHTHSNAVVALTNTELGQAAVSECLGREAVVIGYLRPGFQLSKMVAEAAAPNPTCRAAVLMNHGLITWDDSLEVAYRRHIEIVTKIERFLEGRVGPTPAPTSVALPKQERRRVAAAVAPALRGAICSNAAEGKLARQVLRFDDSPEMLEFIGDQQNVHSLHHGPATPDHLLNTKYQPLVLHAHDLHDSGALKAEVVDQVEHWAAEYRSYFARNSRSGETMLEAVPRIVIFPGVGMWSTGKDARAVQISRDVFQQTMDVVSKARGLGAFRSLPEPEAFLVEYWPLELYKLSLAPPERDLARRVALVTGAAGAIGRAISEALAREGAHLVLTDLSSEACDPLAEQLCSRHGAGRAVTAGLDVTSEESVRSAFEAAALALGGIDIVVSNAGIAHVAALDHLELQDWQRCLDVNATGHFLVAREAIRMMKRQGNGGSIIFNVTKNALSPGADFGAYSISKAAELQLARMVAVEGGPFGIRSNAVNPDAIFSAGLWSDEIRQNRAAAQGIPAEQLEEFYRKRNLLRARVTAEDVAEAVLWLAGDRSMKTTGGMIAVDGGLRDAFPR